MNHPASLVWFRLDLRVADNPALREAARRGGPVVPVFIWAPEEEGAWAPGAASRWWLHQSLASLRRDLRALGSDLVIRRGPTGETLERLLEETGATAVFWNRRYEPAVIARDAAIKTALPARGVTAESFNAQLLFEPWEVRSRTGGPFQVFSAFWRACLARDAPGAPEPAPARVPAPRRWPDSLLLDSLRLEPRIDWAGGLRATWRPGSAGAESRLDDFLGRALGPYAVERDRPDLAGTSELSPHLHFGEISPRRVWHAVAGRAQTRGPSGGAETFLRELGWREFGHHLLFHFPHTADRPLRPEFESFPWAAGGADLEAWRRGRTGYPLVDAGMRQLWATGWMHNRVRMNVASFLVKDLLVPWREGARWFWDTLVDADLANNTLGWQWTAGCGADAAPYFRVFNPVGQGQKFDPRGDYVRRWVPEVKDLPAPWVHKPWEAPAALLAAGGVELGRTYPAPVVDHAAARRRALDAFAAMKDAAPATGGSPADVRKS